MNNDSRTERIAAGLERHFEHCDSFLRDCAAGIQKCGKWGQWELDCTIACVKATTQIAGMIARFESLATRDTGNRGSNPQ